MRQEVESLLRYENRIQGFLEDPPSVVGAPETDQTIVDDEFIGEIIDGRYVVTQRVGAGGMGVVYRADHRLLGTAVAIKRLTPELRDRSEYRVHAVDEARRAGKLDHDNVARVIDVVEESNEVFVILEFIDGNTLSSRLDEVPSVSEFLEIAIQCASALRAAHEKRIAHLDIKPANIMLTAAGKVKVCDFGIARQLPQDGADAKDSRWTFAGTPAYMAPEVLEGNHFDVGADIFSLGVVFYEWLAGTHPFRSTDVRATTNKILKDAPPSLRALNKKLPGRLTRLIEKMLSKDPADRLSAAETLHELRAIQLREKIVRDAWSVPAGLAPLMRRRPVAAFSLIAVTLLLVAGAAYYLPSFLPGYAPLPRAMHVAVIPFRVQSNSPDKVFYARGISEMLSSRLCDLTGIPNLHIDPASYIREHNIDTVQKARVELSANLVIDGMFEFSGNHAIFHFSLIRADDGKLLRWGTVKTADADDFSFVDDIIHEVSRKLELQLAPPKGSDTKSGAAFALYREGMGFLSQYHNPENLEAATQYFSQAVEIDPMYAAAYSALGQAYWYKFGEKNSDLSLLDQSLEACTKADALANGNSDAQVCLGRVYQEKGDFESAIRYYRQAVQYSATNDKAFESLGRALEEANRFDEAEKEYLRAIDLKPDDWGPQSWIAGFYDNARHDYQKALLHYNSALNLSKDNARVHSSVASAFSNLGEYEMAVKSLEEAARLRPWASRPVSNLGVTYLMWGKFEKALPELEKAFQLERPGDLDVNYRITGNLARVYGLMHQTEKAREMYELAINQGNDKLRVDPRDHRVHILLGRYYAMIQKQNEAKTHLRNALNARPRDPHYLLIAATAYVALDEKENALSCIEQAASLGYNDIQIRAEHELNALRNEPRYIALMSTLQAAR
jgi:serine/threonine protein kinase/Flp pilus assembly protein TadD